MQLAVHNIKGEVVDHVELKDEVFAVAMNQAVVHQALVQQRANARRGTASTKTRSQVAGGGRKPFRQKGTGRARRGSQSSPLLKGGGVTFGPQPRSYRQAMPRKMRRLALRCVLSAKAADGEMLVLDELKLDRPRTADMARILEALDAGRSALIVTEEANTNVVKAARNLEGARTLPASMLNVADILTQRKMVITLAAARRAEELWSPEAEKLVKA